MTGVVTDPLLQAAITCVDDFYARLFRDWPEAETRELDACTISYCGNPRLNGANHLFPHTPDALTPAVLAEAEAFFRRHDAAWTVIYTDRFMPQSNALLAQRGYTARWHSPLMVLEGAPRALEGSADARVLRATTPEHLEDVMRVLRDSFGTSRSVSQHIVRREHLGRPPVYHYLVYAARTAIACATTTLHANGMVTVWNVGTRHLYRRRGYAKTIMHGLLSDARAMGAHTSILLASREGQALYEALGYRTLARTYYMGPPSRSVITG